MSQITQSPPSYGQPSGMQWGGAPAGSAQQQMMQTQGAPPMTNQQGMPPSAQGQFRMPQGQFRMPGMAPPPQSGPAPGGMAPPQGAPGMAPPQGGVEQAQMYQQMLQNKGGFDMPSDGYDRSKRSAQMAYAEKYGTGYDPRGALNWMANPSKKDRRSMAKINALRSGGSVAEGGTTDRGMGRGSSGTSTGGSIGRRQRQAVGPTGY